MKRPPSLAEEAQRWERILKNGDSSEWVAFATWIKRSPQHLEAYLRNAAVEAEIQQLDLKDQFDISGLLTKASANVIHLNSDMPRRRSASLSALRRRRPWYVPGVVVASVLVMVYLILTGIQDSSSQWTDYITDTGEQRRIVLADGSTIELNTSSHIRASIQPNLRALELLVGEALFNVKHDADRPFRIQVGDRRIEDLGTQFSVYLRQDESMTVSVIDGRVQVCSSLPNRTIGLGSRFGGGKVRPTSLTEVSGGEEIRVAMNGTVIQRVLIDISAVAAWRQHRLWFAGAVLREVAAEFNRYNKRQLHIGNDPELLKKRYSGTFDMYDPESFVGALRNDPALTVRLSEREVLIEARR